MARSSPLMKRKASKAALVTPAVEQRKRGPRPSFRACGRSDLLVPSQSPGSVSAASNDVDNYGGDDDDDDESIAVPAASTATRARGSPRRVLFGDQDAGRPTGSARRHDASATATATAHDAAPTRIPVTPSTTAGTGQNGATDVGSRSDSNNEDRLLSPPVPAKRRLLFGRDVGQNYRTTTCPPNVERVYRIVRRLTGSLGGNGSSGPIYGELTMHSMQKMVDWMIQTTGLNDGDGGCRFLDVGSGIGKPNFHVAQYPGVEFSCGVEMEHSRYALGMTCLKAIMDAAVTERHQQFSKKNHLVSSESLIQAKTMFLHKNILEAETFDPFTHVYMFSIGFPPSLWVGLAERWNRSLGSTYLICYHGPKDIIHEYEFHVGLVAQTQTLSMHGSKEGHTAYVYRRSRFLNDVGRKEGTATDSLGSQPYCDPVFQPSYRLVAQQPKGRQNQFLGDQQCDALHALQREVNDRVKEFMGGTGRTTRSKQQMRLTR